VLWEIKTNQEIALLPTYGVRRKPEWSPDGKQVAMVKALTDTVVDKPGDQELFSLNREGAATRLTYLTEYYDRVELGQFSWSPDGRYIAFGLYAEPFQSPDVSPQDGLENVARLAVLDTHSHVVTNYCVPIYYGWISPIWSPDSQQLLIEDVTEVGKSLVYLVDIQQGFAAKIAEDVSPQGWMVLPGK
jgi:hypothetical protein